MNKALIVILIILLVIIVGGVYYFFFQKPVRGQPVISNQSEVEQGTSPAVGEGSFLEQPSKAKFDEYLSNAYLAKLSAGEEFNPPVNPPAKTSVFIATDQFCLSIDIKKDIATGTLAVAVYDTITKQDVKPKSVFPMGLSQGNTVGCEPLSYSAGKYEYKIYLEDILTAILPFEVQ